MLSTSPHSSTWASETTIDVGRQAQRREHALQAHDLAEAVGDARLDDQQVDVAVGSGLPARVRAEEDHARSGRGGGDAAARLRR